MPTNDDLKPCPFCGCEPEIQTVMDASDKAEFTLIRCSNECCVESTGWCRTNSEAIAAWNSRAEETTMPTNELKPCPFCGGEADLFKGIDGSWSTWIIECDCGIEIRFISKEEAIKAWNKRETDGE